MLTLHNPDLAFKLTLALQEPIPSLQLKKWNWNHFYLISNQDVIESAWIRCQCFWIHTINLWHSEFAYDYVWVSILNSLLNWNWLFHEKNLNRNTVKNWKSNHWKEHFGKSACLLIINWKQQFSPLWKVAISMHRSRCCGSDKQHVFNLTQKNLQHICRSYSQVM